MTAGLTRVPEPTEPPSEADPLESTAATLDLGPGPALTEPDVARSGSEPRYALRDRLGQGSMGQVFAAWDQVLEREVALKVLHPRLRRAPRAVQRLREEARMIARLEHPGVIPVYDVGTLPDERLFFVMKRVQGSTLDLASEARPLRRKVLVLVSVAQTLAYAHARGVVHRDLKPSNVMVGAFGEVLVLDWGIAHATLDRSAHAIAGTPAWMAPEQARGAEVGPPADAWALGAMLYLALTGRRIHDTTLRADAESGARTTVETLLDALRDGVAIPPPAAGTVDPALSDLAMSCLAFDPATRPEASAFAQELESWLDGTRRRSRAASVVEAAVAQLPRVRLLQAEADALLAHADEALSALPPDAADHQRAPAWADQDRARQLERQASVTRARVLQQLQGALSIDPECPSAHRHLAQHHASRHAEAEAAGDPEADAVLPFLEAHNRDHAWDDYLRGVGSITLRTEPVAQAHLYRYVLHNRRWFPEYARPLGPTPLEDVELPIGSYRLALHAPGCAPIDIPFVVRRLQCLDLNGPGSALHPDPLVLPGLDAIGPRECAVPPGWFQSGTGVASGHPLPRRTLWSSGFVMQRYPVTNRDWLDWLDWLDQRGRGDEARDFAVKDGDGTPIHHPTQNGWQCGTDMHGHTWSDTHPVVRVPWAHARAYAAWRSGIDGVPWRLPREMEWVQAARGADYRIYPWGDAVEVTWARMVGSPGPEGPHSIYRYPADTSPFGVRHLGGQASCWLLDAFSDGTRRLLRGGSWAQGAGSCRADRRKAAPAESRSETIGVRLVRPWPTS